MSKRVDNKSGISIPEVLFVFSILLFILSITVPVYLTAKNNKMSQMGYAQMKVLFGAAKQMESEYRHWPTYKAPKKGDVQYGENLSNVFVMNMLMAVDGEGNIGHNNNLSQINFVDLVSQGEKILVFNQSGEVVDPWGTSYQFVFDADYNNICTIPSIAQGSVFGTGVAIWSYGPDKMSDTKDDLRSWVR